MKRILYLIILVFASFSAKSQEVSLSAQFESHISYLASEELEGRGLGTQGKILAKNYIKDQFQNAGLKPYKGDFFQNFEVRIGLAWVQGSNIVGIIEGADPDLKDEYIVLGAHYDHLGYTISTGEKVIFPGADDNASGVAAIIELGKHFSQTSNRPGRSLIFIAFDAEESGLLGASHFTSSLSEEEALNIKAMFSFDMVGMYELNGGIDLKGIGTIKNGEEFAKSHIRKHDIKLHNVSSNIERRTDTYPFGKIGIPAIHVFTGLKSPYHKPEDKYNLLDYQGMEKIHNYMADLINDLSTTATFEVAESFKNSAAFSGISEPARSNKTVSFGIVINNGTAFHYYKNEFFKAKSVYHLSAGVSANIKLSNLVSLQPQILYDMNGSQNEGGLFRRHSIMTPLNLQIGTPSNTDIPFRAFLFAGGYYRYNFAGLDNGVDLNYDQVYSRNEYGMSWGIGFDIFNFQIAYTHRRSFTGIKQNDSMVLARENMISLGYTF